MEKKKIRPQIQDIKLLTKIKPISKSSIEPIKPKGQKTTRSSDWKLFEKAYKILHDKDIVKLISTRILLNGTLVVNNTRYIAAVLGILPKKSKDQKIKELLKKLHDALTSDIEFLRSMMNWMKEKIKANKIKKLNRVITATAKRLWAWLLPT